MRFVVALATVVFLRAAPGPAWAQGEGAFVRVARAMNPGIGALEREIATLTRRLDVLPPLSVGRQGERLGFHSDWFSRPDVPLDVVIDLGQPRDIDAVALVPVSTVFQGRSHPAYGFPRRFVIDLSLDAGFHSPRQVFEGGNADVPSPGDYPLVARVPGVRARFVRIRVLRHWSRADGRHLSALGEVIVLSGARNVAVGAKVDVWGRVSLPAWHWDNLVDGQSNLGLPIAGEPSDCNGFRSDSAEGPQAPKWVSVDLGRTVDLEEIRLIPALPLDAPNRYGHGFPVRFRVLVSETPERASARVLAAHTDADFPNPGDNPVIFGAEGQRARYVWVEALRLWHVSAGFFALALGELQVYERGRNVALGARVEASDVFALPEYARFWQPAALVDGFSSQNRLLELDAWLHGLDERRRTEAAIAERHVARRASLDHTVNALIGGMVTMLLGTTAAFGGFGLRRRRQATREAERLRSRIARDLHDDLGSRLGGMRLLSEAALASPGLPGPAREDLREINDAARDALEAMRDIVWLTDGLPVSLVDLCRHLQHVAGETLGRLPWTWTGLAPGTVGTLSFEARRQVLLAFRESLGNVNKHAAARNVAIAVSADAGWFTFVVRDDGVGFDASVQRRGLGLENLRLRARALGGRVAIESAPGQGTSVTFQLPSTGGGVERKRRRDT